MKAIDIQFIPYEQMRYATLGDWVLDADVLSIDVAVDAVPNMDTAFLIALHELVEVYLCMKAGITTEMVDQFDMVDFPKAIPDAESEPGDHPDCPYRAQHRQAMLVEHLVANMLGMIDYGTVT